MPVIPLTRLEVKAGRTVAHQTLVNFAQIIFAERVASGTNLYYAAGTLQLITVKEPLEEIQRRLQGADEPGRLGRSGAC